MSELEQLSEDQMHLMDIVRSEWIDRSLGGDNSIDDQALREGINFIYGLANLKSPIIIKLASPYSVQIAANILQKEGISGDQIRDQVVAQIRGQVGAQIRAQIRAQVEAQVEAQVGGNVFKAASDGFDNYGISAMWSSWGAYVSFFRDVCGWRDPVLEKFVLDETIMKSCGWTWWHQNVLVISDRPMAINLDERGRLHSATGPSIAYRDGWALHHWHGVFVSPWIIEDPKRITTGLIEAEENAEVRRVMIERYGEARYIADSGLKPIAQDTFGELYRKDFDGDAPLVYVKVMNSTPEPDGSIKPYFLAVNPQHYAGEAGRFPHAAVASTWRKGKEGGELFFSDCRDYRPGVQT